MPVRRKVTRKVGRRSQSGKGLLDWLKRAGKFLGKTKLLSKSAMAASRAFGPDTKYGKIAGDVGKIAESTGFGRRRVYRGRGLKLSGGALRLSGGRRYR